MTKLSVDDLSKYVLFLENQGLKIGTRSIYVSALKGLWHWLYRQNLVGFDSDLIPTPKRDFSTHYETLDEDEYQKILSLFDEFYPKELRNKAVIAVLYNTGVRIGELLSMNLGDIDMANNKILVKTSKRRNHKREVYFGEDAKELLRKWIDVRQKLLDTKFIRTDALWLNLSTYNFGERIRRCAIQRIFRVARTKLNLEKRITPHSCRHGFAAKGIKNNINVRYLQVMMGHAKLSTTEIYMGYKNCDVESEYRKIYACA